MAKPQTGRVTVENDVVFGTGGGRDLKCNVYWPPQQGADRPAVLLIHGGAWIQGDRSQLHGYGILLGRFGYVCVATEYRLAGESKWPAQIHDAKAALRWMRANAKHLGIDPNKIAVSGNSAGAHLALIMAGTPNMPEFEGDGGNAGIPTDVSACIAFYAPTKLYADGGPADRIGGTADRIGADEREAELLPFLFGAGYTQDTARLASPLTHASPSFPPTMLITGDRDETVPYQATMHMYDALVAAGAKTELHVFEGQPHAFDAVQAYGRQTAALMTLFLDRHVRNATGATAAAAAG